MQLKHGIQEQECTVLTAAFIDCCTHMHHLGQSANKEQNCCLTSLCLGQSCNEVH